MKTGEQFECLDCYHVGSLDIRGGCEHCHSQAVISAELVSLLSNEVSTELAIA